MKKQIDFKILEPPTEKTPKINSRFVAYAEWVKTYTFVRLDYPLRKNIGWKLEERIETQCML